MADAAAISGDFATYRHVQGRKVLQLVIEVPAEMASAVFAALGTPGAGEGIPVALARLQTAPEPIAKPTLSERETVQKERRPFSELPYSQQAAMRCQEPDFYQFLRTKFRPDAVIPFDPQRDKDAPPAVPTLRHLLWIKSRRELDEDAEKGAAWTALEAEYYAWSRGMR